jgi:RNA polymerase subunit RPABC4/transcription elongation factor Spt4
MEPRRCRKCRRRLSTPEPQCPYCGGEVVDLRESNWVAARDILQSDGREEAGPFRFLVIAAIVLVVVAVVLAIVASMNPAV